MKSIIVVGKTYYVDYSIGNCSCPVGKHGAPCKHQYAVVTKYNLTSEHFFPIHDSQMKNKLYFIATGKLIDDDTWCDNLINQNKNTKVIQEPNVIVENSKKQCIDINNTNQNIPLLLSDEPDSKVIDNLKQTFNILENKLLKDGQLFRSPIKKFLGLFNDIKTDSGLISALNTFGKYNGAGMPKFKPRKNLQGSKVIGVQTTTISRRKVIIGSRKVQTSGRPPKDGRINEHGYNKRKILDSIKNKHVTNKKKKAPIQLNNVLLKI